MPDTTSHPPLRYNWPLIILSSQISGALSGGAIITGSLIESGGELPSLGIWLLAFLLYAGGALRSIQTYIAEPPKTPRP